MAKSPARRLNSLKPKRVCRQERQAHLGQQLVVRQCGRHDAGEELLRRNDPRAAHAPRDHLGAERDRDGAPFGRRVGVGDAAAKGAARADRVMRDVAHDRRQQPAQRAVDDRAPERRVPDAGADAELAVLDREPPQRLHAVDVDEMRRPGQPERHGRHEALPSRQDAPVMRRNLGQNGDRLVDRLGRVIAEYCGFHRALAIGCPGTCRVTMTAFTSAVNPRRRDSAAEIS